MTSTKTVQDLTQLLKLWTDIQYNPRLSIFNIIYDFLNLFRIEIWTFKFIMFYHTRDTLGVITAMFTAFPREFKK